MTILYSPSISNIQVTVSRSPELLRTRQERHQIWVRDNFGLKNGSFAMKIVFQFDFTQKGLFFKKKIKKIKKKCMSHIWNLFFRNFSARIQGSVNDSNFLVTSCQRIKKEIPRWWSGGPRTHTQCTQTCGSCSSSAPALAVYVVSGGTSAQQ